jgi:starch phosphorylase
MARLTPRFSSNRMLHEYLETVYRPAAAAYRRRAADGAKLSSEVEAWHEQVAENWQSLRFGEVRVARADERWRFEVQVYCDDLDPGHVRVELYADPLGDEQPTCIAMSRSGPIRGAFNAHVYVAEMPATRPAFHYTPRLVPFHPEARIPLEESDILWKR